MVLGELSYMISHLRGYMGNQRVRTPLAQFHSKSFRSPEPYGVVLVMSPWNYPFMLALEPAIGAIAAGNCVVIKPSAYAPATSAVIAKLIRECFAPHFVAVVEGGRAENTRLLEQRFDFIFFTGSVKVGKLVMEKASRHLTPVCLELGGKSPCIVDQTANLKLAAKRIVFGKYLNLGQTCVAPDYLFVHEDVKEQLLAEIEKCITRQFGSDPLANQDYGRIVNQKHFDRLLGLMEGEQIRIGGRADATSLRIAPTVLDGITPSSPIMQEEIFGPILPVMTFHDLSEVITYVNRHEKPLALYLFTRSKKAERRVLASCSFGGGCINDTIIHLATSAMGFGGVGGSGMGSYHGRDSFELFTHRRSIVKKYNWIDLPFRYQPYSWWKSALVRMFLK
jgi:aldehyde dehydrogenase (NAD+)